MINDAMECLDRLEYLINLNYLKFISHNTNYIILIRDLYWIVIRESLTTTNDFQSFSHIRVATYIDCVSVSVELLTFVSNYLKYISYFAVC